MLNCGDRFGRLVVIKFHHKNARYQKYYECRCDCGNTVVVNESNLRRGYVKSCKCLQQESRIKHSMIGTRFYRIWKDMKTRCNHKSHCSYPNYGGRGITVCDKWNNFIGFKEDMYESYLSNSEKCDEKELTLDRIDVDGNYCKENCRWITNLEQQQNLRKTIRVKDEISGNYVSLRRYCINNGLNYNSVIGRLRMGWDLNTAIHKPFAK